MAILADHTSKAQLTADIQRRADPLVDVLQWLATCNENHKNTLIEGCPICTYRAFNAAKYSHKDLDAAYAFIAKLDPNEAKADLRAMADAWGDSCPEWLTREVYGQ